MERESLSKEGLFLLNKPIKVGYLWLWKDDQDALWCTAGCCPAMGWGPVQVERRSLPSSHWDRSQYLSLSPLATSLLNQPRCLLSYQDVKRNSAAPSCSRFEQVYVAKWM